MCMNMAELSKVHCVHGLDQQVIKWAAQILGIPDFGLATAIAIAKGTHIIAGCVYNNFHRTPDGAPNSIEITMVSIDKSWCNRAIIRELLNYPFTQLKVRRVQLTIAKRNMAVRRFNERLGFKFEGVARKAHFTGEDAAVYSMLSNEWKASPYNGQKRSSSSTT